MIDSHTKLSIDSSDKLFHSQAMAIAQYVTGDLIEKLCEPVRILWTLN